MKRLYNNVKKCYGKSAKKKEKEMKKRKRNEGTIESVKWLSIVGEIKCDE